MGEEVTNELYLSQIEVGTPVCGTLSEVRFKLVRHRRAVIEAARREGSRIAAAGTHPFSHWGDQSLTPKARYRELAADFRQVTREQVIFGCHVHVGIADREAAVQAMNRARPWLAPLVALSANSPFWLGADTGYSSYRTELFERFPMAGMPHEFSSRAEFDDLVATLVVTGVIEDGSNIYWDVRPSSHVETLEFRVADVCMTIDDTVMIAGLVRPGVGLPRPLVGGPPGRAGAAGVAPRSQVAGVAVRARRLPPRCPGARAVAASDVVDALLHYVRPWLERAGDWDEVGSLVHDTLNRGNGARRQREALERTGRMEDVVDLIVSETERGVV